METQVKYLPEVFTPGYGIFSALNSIVHISLTDDRGEVRFDQSAKT